MDDLPVRTAFGDDKGDTAGGAAGTAVLDTGGVVEGHDQHDLVGQDRDVLRGQWSAPGAAGEQGFLEITADAGRIGHDGAAAGADKRCVRDIERGDGVDVRGGKRGASLAQDAEGFVLESCTGGTAGRDDREEGQ